MAPCLRKMGEDPDQAQSCGKDTASQVLANVRAIYTLHVSFQTALQEVLVPAPFHTHCIGKIFLDFVSKSGCRFESSEFLRVRDLSQKPRTAMNIKNLSVCAYAIVCVCACGLYQRL